MIVILNINYEDIDLKFSVAELGIPNNTVLTQVMLTTEEGYLLDPIAYRVTDNRLFIRVPKISATVLRVNL